MSRHITPSSLIGWTLTSIDLDGFVAKSPAGDSCVFEFRHDQDCCETCQPEVTTGDAASVIGMALTDCRTDFDDPEFADGRRYYDSHTWTNFNFTTAAGTFAVHWLGESNGYYGEEAYIAQIGGVQ